MIDPSGIHVIDVLYRVSTRAQEKEGESLFNQCREVEEKWAKPNGIKVRRRVEVTESGKSALQLAGRGFRFSRRAEYSDLIEEYQTLKRSNRPDAIVIDWVDRWSRNVLEYSALVMAFRMLGIRLIAVGDGLDLTDPRNDLITNIRAAVGQEQIRITKEKVCEARRSRRERGKWQGGAPPDGYRTHRTDCPGRKVVHKETPDGKKHDVTVRACDCPQTILQRDPQRETTIGYIWSLLESSPLSWQAMAEDVNAKGFRRPNGNPFRFHDLYRIGENPHYAGVMAYNRWCRDEYDGTIKRRRPLADQTLVRDSDSIPDPYITEEAFWNIYKRRFNHQTRYLPRSKSGSVSELTGILYCPTCGRLMSSFCALSSKTCGNSKPRKSPRKRYVYMWCNRAQGKVPTCENRSRVRVDRISALLIERLCEVTVLSDEAIVAALKLRSSQGSLRQLEAERKRLVQTVETADNSRHALTKLFASGAITQADVEAELFAARRDRVEAETRLREVEAELSRQHARPDFGRARTTLSWLKDRWADLTVSERAEALRLLVDKVSYTPIGGTRIEHIRIVAYGKAFVESAPLDSNRKRRAQSPA